MVSVSWSRLQWAQFDFVEGVLGGSWVVISGVISPLI